MDPGTPWEQEAIDGTPGGVGTSNANGTGLAHAWSTAVPALSRDVLGVRPLAPGYHAWAVEPQPVDLDWAQGDVPAAAGVLAVRWQRGDHDSSLRLTVEAPPGTRGRVAVPLLGAGRTIAMDGHVVWAYGSPVGDVIAHRTAGAVVFEGVRGSHTWAWVK